MARALNPQGTFCKVAGDDWIWNFSVSDAGEAKYPGSRARLQTFANPVVTIREAEDPTSPILIGSPGIGSGGLVFTGHNFGGLVLPATDFTVPVWTMFVPKSMTAGLGSFEKRFIVIKVDINGVTTTYMYQPFQIEPEG